MPLTKLLSSEARNTTTLAISSGVPTRPERNGGDLEVHETLRLLFSQSHQIIARSGHDTRTDGIDAYFAFLEVKPSSCVRMTALPLSLRYKRLMPACL